MNQILVTEKIYVTPELRRKKKIYQILFILSIFLIIALLSRVRVSIQSAIIPNAAKSSKFLYNPHLLLYLLS